MIHIYIYIYRYICIYTCACGYSVNLSWGTKLSNINWHWWNVWATNLVLWYDAVGLHRTNYSSYLGRAKKKKKKNDLHPHRTVTQNIYGVTPLWTPAVVSHCMRTQVAGSKGCLAVSKKKKKKNLKHKGKSLSAWGEKNIHGHRAS